MSDWNADQYQRISALQQAMADERLANLTLAGSERILDVGCGDGKITAAVARRLPRGSVLGVDASPEMIAFASRNHILDNLRFENVDARALPFRDEFDLVLSFNALHWVVDQDTALRAIHAALKPNGQAILQFIPDRGGTTIEDMFEDVRVWPRWTPYFPTWTKPYAHFKPEEYRQIAERNGFRVESIALEQKSWDFGSRAGFIAFCAGTFGIWGERLPEAERTAFFEEAIERFAELAGTAETAPHTVLFGQMKAVLLRS